MENRGVTEEGQKISHTMTTTAFILRLPLLRLNFVISVMGPKKKEHNPLHQFTKTKTIPNQKQENPIKHIDI